MSHSAHRPRRPNRIAALLLMCASAMSFESYAQDRGLLAPGEHRSEMNGVQLWYKISGRAQPGQAPVLYLHGGPGYNSYSFEKTIGGRLEAHMQMIYLDERGSGRSERPANHDYAMASLVGDVEALRKKLGVPQLSLMGHSFGGTIALEYAAQHPEKVNKLIILAAASDLPRILDLWQTQLEERHPEAWRQALEGPAGQGLREARATGDACAVAKAKLAAESAALQSAGVQAFRNWQQFRDQRYQEAQEALDSASGLKNTGEIGGAYFGPESRFPCYRFTAFSTLTMPALVMVGRYDGAIGAQQMQALAEQLPHARFDQFDRSAHFVYAEQPDQFVQDVTAFVQPAQ